MRKYQAAWNQLKSNPSEPLKLAAPAAWHRRIYRGIMKEKDEDLVFKYLMKEDGKYSRLSRESNGGQLIIRIKFFIGLSDLI